MTTQVVNFLAQNVYHMGYMGVTHVIKSDENMADRSMACTKVISIYDSGIYMCAHVHVHIYRHNMSKYHEVILEKHATNVSEA